MDFMKFKGAVAARFEQMKSFPLFRTTAPKDLLWDTYLNSLLCRVKGSFSRVIKIIF